MDSVKVSIGHYQIWSETLFNDSDWKYAAPILCHAYNATDHDSTGYSPFFLIYGRHPRLAIIACLGLDRASSDKKSCLKYVQGLEKNRQYAYKAASVNAALKAKAGKHHYDKKGKESAPRQELWCLGKCE